MWGFDSSHFDVQYQGSLISEDTDHTKCKVIQEMENTYPLTGNDRISDYGFLTQNDIQNLISGTDCGALGFLWILPFLRGLSNLNQYLFISLSIFIDMCKNAQEKLW
jgi:hypothetical protein